MMKPRLKSSTALSWSSKWWYCWCSPRLPRHRGLHVSSLHLRWRWQRALYPSSSGDCSSAPWSLRRLPLTYAAALPSSRGRDGFVFQGQSLLLPHNNVFHSLTQPLTPLSHSVAPSLPHNPVLQLALLLACARLNSSLVAHQPSTAPLRPNSSALLSLLARRIRN